ncbi:MAG: acyltransferase [Leptodesmis sp.]|uniref:acyltransferase n=1 Tax=Leptodesmis sp. TaxID=3100501 RepID=UPI003D10B80A
MKNQYHTLKASPAWESLITRLIALIPPVPKAWSLRRRLYQLILAQMSKTSFIQEGVEITGGRSIFLGNNTAILRHSCLIAESTSSKIYIGDAVTVNKDVEIEAKDGAIVEIGDRTFINKSVWIMAGASVKIGKDCLIAPYVGIVATNRSYADPNIPINRQAPTSKGITIGDDCWLGHRVSVLDGVTIGQGCVIGAGAVVTKDIPPYSIAVGVPAKVVGSRKLGEVRDFKAPVRQAG